ncbi:helicase-related protein [Terribacillus sp. AE2B 122]|uniref:helicase-related protein n=1 Tax=Terribacillus sp. AE2B 122 TaxID=1331902 RepID=UPI001440E261|nr:helicase-related protein [Terribacillus sp. AE2B 122]VVM33798.1 dead/deah box helicase domain protein2C putative [Terribacillus sp. AE2B 122]
MNFINEERLKACKDLLHNLKANNTITKNEYKYLLETAFYLLSSDKDEAYNLGLSIICHVAEAKPQDAFIQQLLFDCINESRVFLYHDMYKKIDTSYTDNIGHGIMENFSESFYTLNTGTILTRDQKQLFEDFQKFKRLVVSAPTSFGKSRIVSEIINHNSYNNIAIILPTIALLNETYLNFRKNPLIRNRYRLINTLTQEFDDNGNIFILTPEKMDLLLDQNTNLKIDFFTMDEIYKIQDDEERKHVFTHCLYRLSKMANDFYLIGPYFQKFSKEFLDRTDAKFNRYSAEIVQKDTIDISKIAHNSEYVISNNKFKKLKDNDRNLINITNNINGQTLVYLGRKDTVETRARKLAGKRDGVNIKSDLIDYIRTTIDEDWSLAHCLSKGIAFHHGAIPKYIQTEIVDEFNNGNIDILVCTSTLTEGVNTSAKNVVIYDNSKGINALSGFDVKNIKGRAGRFLSHFIGRVIALEPISKEEEKETIEFSYYDNENLTVEEIIQVDKNDLSNKNLDKRNETEKNLESWKIPLELIQKNKFIPIHNQYSLINFLRNNTRYLSSLLFSSHYPRKEQLKIIMDLCYAHLFNEADKNNKSFSIGNLKRLTNFYVYSNPSIKELIKTQNGEKTDTRVRLAFSLISRYFEFALPKYLSAFEVLFNYVYFEKNNKRDAISLKALITKLEFGSTEKHEIALKEAGVPIGIINKISSVLQDCDNIDKIKAKLALNPDLTGNLSDYEKIILSKYV